MYCEFCGKENNAEYVFCKYCGKKLHQTANIVRKVADLPQTEVIPILDSKTEMPSKTDEEVLLSNNKETSAKGEEETLIKAESEPVNGTDKEAESKPDEAVNLEAESATVPDKNDKKPFDTRILLISVIVFLMIVIGVMGFIFIRYINKSESKKDSAQSVESTNTEEDGITGEGAVIMTEEPDSERTPVSGKSENHKKDKESIDSVEPQPEEEIEQESEQEKEVEEEKREYILPDSSTKRLYKSDLEGFTAEECRIARNEIYARHGRKFKDQELQDYFDGMDWYNGTIEPDRFKESVLSNIELDNINMIVEYEKQEGYR